MNKRTIDEMITHFNQEVSNMDIAREYKMALLGMITAIGYESKKQEVVRCKDCKYFRQHSIDDIKRCGFNHDGMCVYWNSHSTNFEWFCVNGERRDPCSSQDS